MPGITGRYERTRAGGEEVAAFIPEPLSPRDPPLALGGGLAPLLSRAEAALGRLDLASAVVPSVGWLLYSFVRKEAVVSSRIEGTKAALMDLFAFEAAGEADSMETRDVREVCNYLDAIACARRQLESPKGLPLSARLPGETHRRLMRGVRGAEKSPGQIRRSQNRIGGTRPGNEPCVPPPPPAVGGLLSGLERFLHGESDLPALVRAGLCHAQFETIGRVVGLPGATRPTANKAVSTLVNAGVLVETTGRRRDRAFGYAACLDRLRAGTEVPESGMATTSPAHGRRPPTAEPSARKRQQPVAEEPPRA